MGRDRSKSGSYSDDDRRERSESPRAGKDELREFWAPVRDDPHDFDAWTRLLQFVEQKNDPESAEDAFDAFLKLYPFCYGYWRKYAELQKRNHRYEKALNVYERGVKEISLSVDLWLAYIGYIKEIGAGQAGAIPKTRAIFMRALDAAGLDFRSDKLWTQYIDWEISIGDYLRASQVYDILLGTPTMGYLSHFERYRQFIESYEPDKILSDQEYESISDRVYEKVKHDLDGQPMFFTEEYEEEIPENEMQEDGRTKRLISRRRHAEVALIEFRSEILLRRTKLHHANELAVNARLKFENGIRRPYFHIKPLEREQLLNWYNYLDFEISEKKKKRIQILFERCVITCAQYDEFWIKYATYYDSQEDVEHAREIYQRAAEIHCSRKPGIHLALSAFLEKHGKQRINHAICLYLNSKNLYNQTRIPLMISLNCSQLKWKRKFLLIRLFGMNNKHGGGDPAEAYKVLQDFDKRHPGYVAISMRKLNIERRRFSRDKSPDYSSITGKLEKLVHEPGNSRRVSSFYAMKLARFHSKVGHDRRSAERVLKDAIARDKDNLQLYMGLIDVAFASSRFRESEVIDAFDYGMYSKHLTTEQRFLFSQRKLDFLEELGNDPGRLQDHYVEHLKLEKQLDEPAPTLFSNIKRKAEPTIDEPVEKRIRESGENGMNQFNVSPAPWNLTPDINMTPTQYGI